MDRLDRILTLARTHRPEMVLVDKADSRLMRAAGMLARPFMPNFDTGVTTVIGDCVYTPGPPDAMKRDELAAILAHELVHQLDQAQWGSLFYLSYAALAPAGRTMRAHWERRAYAVDLMLAHHERGEQGLRARSKRIVALFAGPAYGWMWAGEGAARSYLQPVMDAVRTGRLQQEEPYLSILAAWRG